VPLPGVAGFAARYAVSWRLIRRGAALIWLTVLLYMTIEVLVFRGAYPDAASRQRLLDLSTSTAVRMMQGVPGAIDTAGGFAVWDGGWQLMIIVGCWAALTMSRLARGEEDAGRADLVLSRPLTVRQALGAHCAALATAAGGIAVGAAAPFLVLGEAAAGALVWGSGLALLCAVAAALAALVSQAVQPRRRVATVSLGLLAAAFLVRIVANSADPRSWMLSLTPFGWVERLRAFSDNAWGWLVPPAALTLVFAGAAFVLTTRRDTGAALVQISTQHRSTFRLLGSASGFIWRLGVGALTAWTLTLAITTFVLGMMTDALVDFINHDAAYRRMLRSMGVDVSVPAAGYLSYLAVFLALPCAVFLGWRIGALRQEEAEGRLDNLLVRGVLRTRLLAAAGVQAFGAAAILVAASTLALWAGAEVVGAPVTTRQIVEPMAGTLPLVGLFTGIAVLTFGLAPRLTLVVPVTVAVLGYLLDTLGAALDWPGPVLALSPFHHLARLPADPMTVGAASTMTGLGIAAAAIGVRAFARRDLRGE
jgi:ABC-2 type transport system permease protein